MRCKHCGTAIRTIGQSIHRCTDRQWVAHFDGRVISQSPRLQTVAQALEDKKAELRGADLLSDAPWSARA
jgi:hypothetical protein